MFNRKYTSSNGGFFIVILVLGGEAPTSTDRGIDYSGVQCIYFKSLQNRETEVTRQCQVPFAASYLSFFFVVEVEVLTLVQKETSLWGFTHFP